MRIFNRFLTALLAMVMMLSLSVSAFAATSIPDYNDAFYVNDYADVISQETEEKICAKGYDLAEATGSELVITTVDFLGGMDIEDYAKKMFNKWQLGDPIKNNGVLLLLVIGEENYWVTQGKGLEDTLSSGKLGTILEEALEPDFALEDYDAGALKTYDRICSELCQIYGIAMAEDGSLILPEPEPTPEPVIEKEPFPMLAVVLIAVVITAVIMLIAFIIRINRPRPRRYGVPIPPPSAPNDTMFERPIYRNPNIGGLGGMGGTRRYGSFGHRPGSFTTSGRRTGGFGGSTGGFGGSAGRSSFGGSRGGRIGGGGSSRGGGAGRR